MTELVPMLSAKESDQLERFAARQGLTGEQALRELAMKNLDQRLSVTKKSGEVRPFRLPKKHRQRS